MFRFFCMYVDERPDWSKTEQTFFYVVLLSAFPILLTAFPFSFLFLHYLFYSNCLSNVSLSSEVSFVFLLHSIGAAVVVYQ